MLCWLCMAWRMCRVSVYVFCSPTARLTCSKRRSVGLLWQALELGGVAEAPVAQQVEGAMFARWNLLALCECCVLVHLACVDAEQCSWPWSVCSWPVECAVAQRSDGGAPRSDGGVVLFGACAAECFLLETTPALV